MKGQAAQVPFPIHIIATHYKYFTEFKVLLICTVYRLRGVLVYTTLLHAFRDNYVRTVHHFSNLHGRTNFVCFQEVVNYMIGLVVATLCFQGVNNF